MSYADKIANMKPAHGLGPFAKAGYDMAKDEARSIAEWADKEIAHLRRNSHPKVKNNELLLVLPRK